MLVISDRFTKLTQVVPLKRITAYDVAFAFVEHWVFKYGAPATLLSDNGSQFVAHFFRRVCNILQAHNIFTTTYHPQTNGQVERFNRTLAAMFRCYVEDKPGLWCLYAPALCYAYNMSVHSTTCTTPFDLVLSRPPPEFTRDNRPQLRARTARAQKNDYVQRLQVALQKASRSLQRAQARYKRDFDRGIRATRRIRTDNYIFLDTHDGPAKRPKLTHNISGPFRVLGHDSNTIVIQRDEVVGRVSGNRVTLAPKQAITRAARTEDAQPKHLQAKHTNGRSYTFSKILVTANCKAATLSSKSRGTATTSQHGNHATVSQRKQYRATSRGTGANLPRASKYPRIGNDINGANLTRASDRRNPKPCEAGARLTRASHLSPLG